MADPDDFLKGATAGPSPFRGYIAPELSEGPLHFAPSAERNRLPITNVLCEILPPSGRILEVASGTGQHAAAFAGAFPRLRWIPSDPDPDARASIKARARGAGRDNLAPPLDIDVSRPQWFAPVEGPFAAILAINLLHIAPWAACTGLLDGAAALLARDGLVYIYGCWRRGGRHLSESNAAFDRSLRQRDPAWGVRDTDDLAEAAATRGLTLAKIIEMPANNLSLVLRRVT